MSKKRGAVRNCAFNDCAHRTDDMRNFKKIFNLPSIIPHSLVDFVETVNDGIICKDCHKHIGWAQSHGGVAKHRPNKRVKSHHVRRLFTSDNQLPINASSINQSPSQSSSLPPSPLSISTPSPDSSIFVIRSSSVQPSIWSLDPALRGKPGEQWSPDKCQLIVALSYYMTEFLHWTKTEVYECLVQLGCSKAKVIKIVNMYKAAKAEGFVGRNRDI